MESLAELEVATGGEVAASHLGGSFLGTGGVGTPLWGLRPEGIAADVELARRSS